MDNKNKITTLLLSILLFMVFLANGNGVNVMGTGKAKGQLRKQSNVNEKNVAANVAAPGKPNALQRLAKNVKDTAVKTIKKYPVVSALAGAALTTGVVLKVNSMINKNKHKRSNNPNVSQVLTNPALYDFIQDRRAINFENRFKNRFKNTIPEESKNNLNTEPIDREGSNMKRSNSPNEIRRRRRRRKRRKKKNTQIGLNRMMEYVEREPNKIKEEKKQDKKLEQLWDHSDYVDSYKSFCYNDPDGYY